MSSTTSNNSISHSQWSAIAFLLERNPSFLAYPEGYDHTKERICGFLMLIECREYAVLFKSNLELPSTFKTEYLQRVGDQHFEAAVAPVEATFEKLTLRNMTSSRHTLRSKTLRQTIYRTLLGELDLAALLPKDTALDKTANI